MKTRELRNVPEAEAPGIIADFQSEGARATARPEGGGTVTIVAVWPDRPAAAAPAAAEAAMPAAAPMASAAAPAPSAAPADAAPAMAWYAVARAEMGETERPGDRHNPRILEYHATTTLGAGSDEVPWCSAFVNFCVERGGGSGTRSALARSWLEWGRPIDAPVEGCIVVLSRGEPPAGHVGFYVGDEGDSIRLLGGNQGNAVCIRTYPKSRVLGYRLP